MKSCRRRRVSLCRLVAAVFGASGLMIGAGCARITTLDIQLSPAGPADALGESATLDQATAALSPPSPGDILMVGGAGGSKASVASAEFYSLTDGKFHKTGAMKKARAVEGGAALTGQKVAIFGGMKGHATSSFELLAIHSTVLNSAESYDGATGKFTTVPNLMVDARTGFTATFFPSGALMGKVLIAGGNDGSGVVDTAEIYDPTNNTFTAAGNTMTDPREFHTATLFASGPLAGKVLIAGGLKDETGDISTTADIFDPATQQFTQTTGDMTIGRAAHTASLLTTGHTGQVLLVGGAASSISGPMITVSTQSSAELFDPSSQTFAPDGSMTESRAIAAAVTLGDGRVLITGGMAGGITINGGKLRGFGSTSNSSEIYDPVADTFTCINGSSGFCNPSMTSTRAGHIATLITSGPNNGNVLIAGGVGAKSRFAFNDRALKTAELFTVSVNSATTVKTSKMIAGRVGFVAVTIP